MPSSVLDLLKDQLIIQDKSTGQRHLLDITFDPKFSLTNSPHFEPNTSKASSFDIIVVILLAFVVILVAYQYYNRNPNGRDFSQRNYYSSTSNQQSYSRVQNPYEPRQRRGGFFN